MRPRATSWIPLAAALVAAAFAPPVEGQGSDPVEIYRLKLQAEGALGERQFTEALRLYREVVAANPHDPYTWRALGRLAEGAGEHDEAVAALTEARRLGVFSPGNTALEIARVEAAARHNEEALEWIDLALQDRRCCRVFLMQDSAFRALRDDPRFRHLAAATLPGLGREEQWREDLRFFVGEAQRMHVGPERPAFAEPFQRASRTIRDSIPMWSDTRIAAELQALAVLLGDGHTGVSIAVNGATRLPIDVYPFEEGVFVVGHAGGHSHLVGSRIETLGGVPIDEAMDRVTRFISRDNEIGVLRRMPGALTALPFLEAAGLVDVGGTVTLTMEAPDGASVRSRLAGGEMRRAPVLAQPPAVDPLLYLRRHQPFWIEEFGDARALYVNFNSVRDAADETLEAFADRLAKRLEAIEADHLIIDIRMNGGGDTFLFNRLVRTVIHFEQDDHDHRVYVLIGRRTFSAAQNFAALLDRFTDALFVGEPTGSRPNFTGESSPATLPYSGLAATISTRNHQNADWEDARRWIAPDVLVTSTAADYFGGRDASLSAVFKLIGSSTPFPGQGGGGNGS